MNHYLDLDHPREGTRLFVARQRLAEFDAKLQNLLHIDGEKRGQLAALPNGEGLPIWKQSAEAIAGATAQRDALTAAVIALGREIAEARRLRAHARRFYDDLRTTAARQLTQLEAFEKAQGNVAQSPRDRERDAATHAETAAKMRRQLDELA